LKTNKKSDLDDYEKKYLDRIKNEKKTTSVEQKKPSIKKTKKSMPKKSTSTKTKKSDKNIKKKNMYDDDTGIVLIDDDLVKDTEAELEERKAYLEESRSQEFAD
jgi:choline kinase